MPDPESLASIASGAAPGGSTPRIRAVTVTYNPDLAILQAQLSQLPAHSLKVWVDNASGADAVAAMKAIAEPRNDLVLVLNDANAGLAAALNQGVREASAGAPSTPFLILLDQDTEPGEGGVEALLDAYLRLSTDHPRLGCIGPRLIDAQTGLEHGFHQISACRWVRRYRVPDFAIAVANLNGSGTLMRSELFEQLGGLDAAFFIDHVDTDWSFRVLASGHELFGIPGVSFRHRMGDRSIRFWLFGWKLWPYRSPGRHATLFRNTIRLVRRSGVPFCWKLWAPIKLLVTMLVHLLFDATRFAQMRGMLSGLRQGAFGIGNRR